MSNSNSPIPLPRLEELAAQSCTEALSQNAQSYAADKTLAWNTAIISSLTTALVKEVPSSSYKFVINSIIIQHNVDTSRAESGQTSSGGGASRGMHAACGAYWNEERDGSWSYVVEGGKSAGEGRRDFDIVVTVAWVGI